LLLFAVPSGVLHASVNIQQRATSLCARHLTHWST